MHQTPEVSLPSTNLEIEIVLLVPGGRVLKAAFRCVRILLCDAMKGLHDDNQDARKDTSQNAFQHVHEFGHAGRLTRIVAYTNSHFLVIRYSHFNSGLHR
jgi:hypothetical protein